MRVGFIGWRGMVGSVLLDRMRTQGDFDGLDASFFSTSSAGSVGPDVGEGSAALLDAYDLGALGQQAVLLSCQGGEYTQLIVPRLRAAGWAGVWIDAASTLRMDPNSTLVLDPINCGDVKAAIMDGCKTFVGANCTVSLLLMGLAGLLREGQVEWISTMSYQAASGAGAAHMAELVAQMAHIGSASSSMPPGVSALALEKAVASALKSKAFPDAHFGAPLAASALPWIDSLVEGGQTREEQKSMVEANKILGLSANPLPIDGICVRIGAMRSHAQALTIKLKADVPISEIEQMIAEAHDWSGCVPNTKADTLARLTPAAVSGSLKVPVGRLRKMKLGPRYLAAFTVGDQLLWGAAEPLRRMLGLLRD